MGWLAMVVIAPSLVTLLWIILFYGADNLRLPSLCLSLIVVLVICWNCLRYERLWAGPVPASNPADAARAQWRRSHSGTGLGRRTP